MSLRDVREVPGPCAGCGDAGLVCGEFAHDGRPRPLCYDCWHAAHEKLPPFAIRRVDTPEHVEEYGHWYFGGIHGPSTMTKACAEEKLAEILAEQERISEWWRSQVPMWSEDQRRRYAETYPARGYPHHATQWEIVPMQQWSANRVAHPGYMQRRRAEIREVLRG